MIRVLLNVLHLVAWLLLLRFAFRALARAFSGKRPRSSPPPPVRPVEDLVLDPVCRTHVPRSRALVARVGGREEHFCSASCRDRATTAVDRAS